MTLKKSILDLEQHLPWKKHMETSHSRSIRQWYDIGILPIFYQEEMSDILGIRRLPSGEMKSRRAPTPLSSFDPKRKKRKFSLRDRRTTLFGSSSYLSSSGGNRICRGGNEPSKIPVKTGISRCDFYLYFRSEEDSGKKKKTALGQQRIQWKVYVHADILFQCDNAEDALFRKAMF